MTLSEILEEQSVKAISAKTMISEENIEHIMAENFSSLAKAKTLGFISILEREYNADLTPLKEKASRYYKEYVAEESTNITKSYVEEKKERSKLLPLIVLGLLAYASWYFVTQFDSKMLRNMNPFSEDTVESKISSDIIKDVIIVGGDDESKKNREEKGLNLKNALTSTQRDIVVASLKPKTITSSPIVVEVKSTTGTTHTLTRSKNITLLPANKLWFGIIDMETGKRDHFSMSEKYQINVIKKSWLIATSPAAFAFINGSRTQEFNDAKSHYFKVSIKGIEELSKKEYVLQGGYKRW